MEKVITKDTIFTYIGLDLAKPDSDHNAYYIYDPRTNKHHSVSKEKYDEVMKYANGNF